MRERLNRVKKVAGVPITKDTLHSLSRAAKDVITNKRATLEERERRFNICRTCEHKNHDRCGLCGCFIKTKTILLNSECPIKKWSTLLSESSVNDSSSTKTNE